MPELGALLRCLVLLDSLLLFSDASSQPRSAGCSPPSLRAPGERAARSCAHSFWCPAGLLGAKWSGSYCWCGGRGGERQFVTRDDFASTCEEVERLLPSAAFCSLDLEMTSLKKAGEGGDQIRWEDTTEERYLAMREVVMSNTIMSVGLCVFHTRSSSGHGASRGPETLVARPYNFLIFPDPASTPNLALDMQTLVDFHVDECNFDFNRWIYSGIPYTDAAGEAELHSAMRAQHGLTAHTHHQMTRSVRERPRVPLTAEGDRRFLRSALEGHRSSYVCACVCIDIYTQCVCVCVCVCVYIYIYIYIYNYSIFHNSN